MERPPTYEKYRIPPDFQLAQLHEKANKIYQDGLQNTIKCECCNNIKGNIKIGLCSRLGKLKKLADQIPLYFMFLYLMVLFVILVIFVKVGEKILICGSNCKDIVHHFQANGQIQFQLWVGFTNSSSRDFMIELIIYSFFILVIKVFLKKKKYDYRVKNQTIQKRSLLLTNVDRDASEKDIRSLFEEYYIDDVVFCYKVEEYSRCLKKMTKIQKQLNYIKKHPQSNIEASIISQKQEKEQHLIRKIQKLKKKLNSKSNKLEVVFVIFQRYEERNRALKKYSTYLFQKIFYKLCVGYSKISLYGKHITLKEAPAPQDINWVNLQDQYLYIKLIRLCSLFVCSVLIFFGLFSELIIFNKIQRDQIGDLIVTAVILIMNFIIVNFLQWTTSEIEKQETKTSIKLSLIKKITFFMFINISIMPFAIFLYGKIDQDISIAASMEYLSFQILLISIGNLFKPLITYLSVERIFKWVKQKYQKFKNQKCQLNQLEANELFQPVQFPIQIYYSLILTTIMMSFFYISIFPSLFIIEIPSIILLYGISKYMLLRVCKSPAGLSVKLNTLAQSLLKLLVPLSWVGKVLVIYFVEEKNQNQYFFQYIFRDEYTIIQVGIVIFMLICEAPISFLSEKISEKTLKGNLYDPFEEESQQRRTYRQTNLYYKMNEQLTSKASSKDKHKNYEFVIDDF